MSKFVFAVRPLGRQFALHLFLSLISAALLVAIFPGWNLRVLAPVALTPLLFVVARTQKASERFWLGWSAGILYWFALCPWIQFVLEVHGGMGRLGGWGSFFLFCFLEALHLAVYSLLAGPLMRTSYAVPAVAALWTGLERTHGTFGFAWLDLGNAGIDMSVPLRLAPYVGVYGLSFCFAMLAAGLACVLLGYSRKRLFPLAALILLWFLPAIRQDTPVTDEAVVVQPNIDPEMEWTPALLEHTEQQMNLLSNAFQAPLVIWPELPAPLYFYSDSAFHELVIEIAKRHGHFLLGTVASNHENQPLNSALLLGPDGVEIGRYDQINLVPFGEFIPPLFSWVNRITKETSDFVPGHDIEVFPARAGRLGVFICYESAFPDLVRQFSARGADVLINISNDGYFGHSDAREQHLLLVRMRAVENRRFIIRSTNDGITAAIDPAGRIIQRLTPYRGTAAVMRYGRVKGSTFYARHGDWFSWSCLGVGLALALTAWRKQRRETGQTV